MGPHVQQHLHHAGGWAPKLVYTGWAESPGGSGCAKHCAPWYPQTLCYLVSPNPGAGQPLQTRVPDNGPIISRNGTWADTWLSTSNTHTLAWGSGRQDWSGHPCAHTGLATRGHTSHPCRRLLLGPNAICMPGLVYEARVVIGLPGATPGCPPFSPHTHTSQEIRNVTTNSGC